MNIQTTALCVFLAVITLTTSSSGASVKRRNNNFHTTLMKELDQMISETSSRTYASHRTMQSVINALEREKQISNHKMIECVHELSNLDGTDLTVSSSPSAEADKIMSRLSAYQSKWHQADEKLARVRDLLSQLCGGDVSVRRRKRQHWNRGLCGFQPGK